MNPNPSPGHQGDLPAKVQVVIVNWNSGVWLGKSVGSIARFGGANVDRVVVVDNASADGSADVIAPGIDLRIIQTGANLGFGKACNLGAAGATAPYLLFLNPDAMLQPGSLTDVLRFMESAEAAGVGVCGIRLVGEAGEVQHHTTNQPTPWTLFNLALLRTRFDHLQSRTVGHVIGAFYLIRREVFEAVGGFDERFFVYLEDLDLSVRVAAAGWKIHYLAEASAFHKGGGTSEQVKAHRLFYSMQSRILYSFKHFATSSAVAVLVGTLTVELAARLARAALRRSGSEISHTVRGYGMLVAALPEILRRVAGRWVPALKSS